MAERHELASLFEVGDGSVQVARAGFHGRDEFFEASDGLLECLRCFHAPDTTAFFHRLQDWRTVGSLNGPLLRGAGRCGILAPMHIGCHLSAAEGFRGLARDALAVGVDVFQFFTRNPRGGAAKPVDPEDVADFLRTAREHAFGPILAHAPYTLNPCSDKPEVRRFAHEVFADDLRRMECVPGNLYNFHPGSHVGQGVEAGIALVADVLSAVLPEAGSTTVLLETMSGKGSEVGGRFEELREILDRVPLSGKLGVCLDTCHVWDAGYDIVGDLDGVLSQFDRVVGLSRLRAVHLNDSRNPLGSRKDRHACIGAGCIGAEALVRVVRHPALRDLPFYLETPQDSLAGWAGEIAFFRKAVETGG